jgi:AmiR/NasT family two-component response regulator
MDKKNVLVLKDEPDLQFDIGKIIYSLGFGTINNLSLDNALKIFCNDQSICLILIDGKGEHWPTTAEKFLEKRRVPIIFWTDEKDLNIIQQMKKTITDGYVIKKSGETVLISFILLAVN